MVHFHCSPYAWGSKSMALLPDTARCERSVIPTLCFVKHRVGEQEQTAPITVGAAGRLQHDYRDAGEDAGALWPGESPNVRDDVTPKGEAPVEWANWAGTKS